MHTIPISLVMAALLALGVSACRPRHAGTASAVLEHEDESARSRAPLSFAFAYAVPERVLVNQPVTLYWCALGADRVAIGGAGESLPPCGQPYSSLRVYPTGSQDYWIRAYNGANEVVRTVTVIAMPMPGLVRWINASQLPVTEGQSTNLRWLAEECDYVTLMDSMSGSEQRYPCGENAVTVAPRQDMTYTVRAFRRGNGQINAFFGGSWEDQLVGVNTLTIPVVKAIPQIFFEANPSDIMEDDSVSLTWSVTNADQVTISPQPGSVGASGAANVAPKTTTTYRLMATRQGGATEQREITITVRPKLKIRSVSMTPSDGVIKRGQDVALQWNSEFCRHVRLELSSGERQSDDRACVQGFVVRPQATTDYYVRIEDLYGAVQRFPFKVTVLDEPVLAIPLARSETPAPVAQPGSDQPPPPAAARPVVIEQENQAPRITEFSANRTEIFKGETIRLAWATTNAKRVQIRFPRRTVTVPASGQREFKVGQSGIIAIEAENERYRSPAKEIRVNVVDPHELLLKMMRGGTPPTP